MGDLRWRMRAAVLVLLGAVAVHRLVYELAGVRPDAHAHAYLAWLTPALFGLVLVGAAGLVLRVAGVGRRRVAPPPRARVLWPVLSVLLVAVFAAQELAEALAGPGRGHHHAVSELVVGHGLWMAVPVAIVVGGVLSLLLRGAAAVEAWCLAIAPRRPVLPPAPAPARPSPRPVLRRAPRDVLGANLAGRAPPLAVA